MSFTRVVTDCPFISFVMLLPNMVLFSLRLKDLHISLNMLLYSKSEFNLFLYLAGFKTKFSPIRRKTPECGYCDLNYTSFLA